MKFSLLFIFGILLFLVKGEKTENFDPDTKYFIFNKLTSRCLKRQLTDNGYTDYYTITYGKCENNDDNKWYIKDGNIISAANGHCFSIVNYTRLGAKDCKKPVIEAIFMQEFTFEDGVICSRLGNCLRDKNGYVGTSKNLDRYNEWVISTSLPE